MRSRRSIPTVGDLDGNAKLILEARAGAARAGADLVVFPEFVVVGYPPEDLVLRPSFQEAARRTLEALAADTAKPGPALLVSSPWVQEGRLYNAALLLAGGGIAAVRLKHELPNYGVFDEKRVFSAGGLPDPMEFAGARLGAMICEDMWLPEVGGHLAARGAEILIVPNGSPFELDKHDVRRRIALERVRETRLPLIYVNQVGGQDELVFDGGSFVMAADGTLAGQCPYWRADLAITRWERDAAGWRCVEAPASPEPGRLEAVYQAMVLGLRDYVEKNRFPGVVLGLSGGIDSALSAAVAVDALGAARVHCVMLPFEVHEQGEPGRSRRLRAPPRREARHDLHRAARRVRGADPRAALRGPRRRSHGGEHPVAPEGRAPDGAFQQVRPHGAHDRQQVGGVGRLRHALRRHVRRLLGAEGRVQGAGLRAFALAQRAPAGRRARSGGRR